MPVDHCPMGGCGFEGPTTFGVRGGLPATAEWKANNTTRYISCRCSYRRQWSIRFFTDERRDGKGLGKPISSRKSDGHLRLSQGSAKSDLRLGL